MEVQRGGLHTLNVKSQINPGKWAVSRLAGRPSWRSTGSPEDLFCSLLNISWLCDLGQVTELLWALVHPGFRCSSNVKHCYSQVHDRKYMWLRRTWGKKQKAMKQKVTEHQLSRDARGQSGTEAEHSLVGQPTSQFQAACRSHMTRSDFFEKLKNPDFYVKSFRF